MKKLITLAFAVSFLLGCSSSDSNNSSNSTSINPPTWIQGYWLQDDGSGGVTVLGLKATADDFYTTTNGSGNSIKTLISNVLQTGGTAIVNEEISASEYKLNVTLNGNSFPQYYYKKITSTKIQYFDTSNVGGSFLIKQ
jgi:hypothetical protein